MICPKCAHTMTDDSLYCECCGTYLAAPQPKLRVVSTSTYRFDLYDQPQGSPGSSAVAPIGQGTAAFYSMCEPTSQAVPASSLPAAVAPRLAGCAHSGVNLKQVSRSRRLRKFFTASVVSMLILGFGGGMSAFATDDIDSRMPIVVEYEETVTPEIDMTALGSDDNGAVTILDDPTPMASSPTHSETAADFALDVEPVIESAPAPAPLAGALEQSPAEPVVEPLAPCTLEVNGTRVPYIHSVFATLCPDNNAALWAGNDDTTDGSYGYFIGHNPGDFACVYALVPGNYVTLCDSNGNLRNYTVTQLYEVPNTTIFQEMAKDVIPQGECLLLQTCIGDGSTYRVVVCE